MVIAGMEGGRLEASRAAFWSHPVEDAGEAPHSMAAREVCIEAMNPAMQEAPRRALKTRPWRPRPVEAVLPWVGGQTQRDMVWSGKARSRSGPQGRIMR